MDENNRHTLLKTSIVIASGRDIQLIGRSSGAALAFKVDVHFSGRTSLHWDLDYENRAEQHFVQGDPGEPDTRVLDVTISGDRQAVLEGRVVAEPEVRERYTWGRQSRLFDCIVRDATQFVLCQVICMVIDPLRDF